MQLHVTDPRRFKPVETAAAVIMGAQEVAPDEFRFRTDPYEYEREKPAIDILTGSDAFRKAVLAGTSLEELRREWQMDRAPFVNRFKKIACYPEQRP